MCLTILVICDWKPPNCAICQPIWKLSNTVQGGRYPSSANNINFPPSCTQDSNILSWLREKAGHNINYKSAKSSWFPFVRANSPQFTGSVELGIRIGRGEVGCSIECGEAASTMPSCSPHWSSLFRDILWLQDGWGGATASCVHSGTLASHQPTKLWLHFG